MNIGTKIKDKIGSARDRLFLDILWTLYKRRKKCIGTDIGNQHRIHYNRLA